MRVGETRGVVDGVGVSVTDGRGVCGGALFAFRLGRLVLTLTLALGLRLGLGFGVFEFALKFELRLRLKLELTFVFTLKLKLLAPRLRLVFRFVLGGLVLILRLLLVGASSRIKTNKPSATARTASVPKIVKTTTFPTFCFGGIG